MSDSRFHLKVEFEIYGQKYKWESSLNYFDRGDGMDDQIFQWFVECYEDAYEKYRSLIMDQQEKDIERMERAELDRLKAKYEPKEPR